MTGGRCTGKLCRDNEFNEMGDGKAWLPVTSEITGAGGV
jgi:hypothetical protein